MYGKHKATTRKKIVELIEAGHSLEKIARMFRGLIDRRTIQKWVYEHRDQQSNRGQ